MKLTGIFLSFLTMILISGCNNIHDGIIDRYEEKLDSFERRIKSNPEMAFNDTASFYMLRRSLESDLQSLNGLSGLLEEQQERVSLLNIRTSMIISSALQKAIDHSKREMEQSRMELDSLKGILQPAGS